MSSRISLWLLIVVCTLGLARLSAGTFPLWPEGALGALGTEDKDIPTLTLTFPAEGRANGTAVIICPGGGYGGLAMNHEGHAIAEWFNSLGVTAAVLKYRLPAKGYPHPVPMQDIQHAIQTLRANSEAWGIDPERIGIFGSSAGGHLVSTAATHFLAAEPDAVNPVLRVSSRPDFLMMLYPVISMKEGLTHGGSRRNLLGGQPDPELVEAMSNELQVTGETPPTFIVHADDDRVVKSENSVLFYLALRKVGVPAELHLYEKGGHGFGMRPPEERDLPVHEWPMLAEAWLRQRGLLDPAK